jgi:type IV pilus assembly protein PilM
VQRDNAESMGGFIRQALAKAKISAKRVVTDVPREEANFYTLRLPKAPLDDLANMVAYQIPKELPYPVEQAAVDFTCRAEAEQEEINDVLVAAVRKERRDFYIQVCEHAGLKLQRLGLRPNANEFAVNALLEATPHERVLFVDVGPNTTEIDVLHNGRLVFSRAASVTIPGDSEGTDALESEGEEGTDEDESFSLSLTGDQPAATLDAVVSELMIEVTRSIEAYRVTDASARLDHAVIGGSSEIEEALADAIEKQYRISAQPYNPASCFGWDADRGAAAGAFAPTLGLMLAQTAPPHRRFDFLHPKKAETRAQRRIKRAPIAAVVAFLFITAGFVFYALYVKPAYERQAELQATAEELEDILEEHRQFERTVAALEQYEQQQIVWLDKLYALVEELPDEKQIVIKNVDMSQKDHRMRFPYRAADSYVASNLLEALDASRAPGEDRPQFKGVLGATSRRQGDRYEYHGSVEIEITDRDFIED